MMKYSFSKRQKAFLLTIAAIMLAGFYFFAVQVPVSAETEELKTGIADISAQLEDARADKAEYLEMKTELERILSLPDSERTYLPDYDNIGELMLCFNDIFFGVTPELRANSVTIEDGVAERLVSFGFSADSYEDAIAILTKLSHTGFRSQLQNLSVTAIDGGIGSGGVKVSGSIVFYELSE